MICDGAFAKPGADAAEDRKASLRIAQNNIKDILAVEEHYAEDCMRRWSYRLSKADGSVDDLAKAVSVQCRLEIQGWKTAAFRFDQTAESTIESEADDRVRLFIIKGRAGACAVRND